MNAAEAPPNRPVFISVSLYNDPSGLLSFWYASEWQLYVAATTLPAITLTPDVGDPQTHMAITVHDIKTPLAARERPSIVAGVRAGLAKLNDVVIESLAELQTEGRWGVEWRCTFLGERGRYRRRGRIFFSDHFQYAIVLQGSSEERYAYWQGMFEWTMLTVGAAPFSLAGWQRAAAEQQEGGARRMT